MDASDEEISDLVGQMHGLACAADRQFLAGVAVFDQREAWRVDGAFSMVMWLEMRHGFSRSMAVKKVEVARGLVYCPTIADTYAAGHLSWDQLEACIDLVAYGRVDEATMAADAVGRSAAELDRLAREAKRVSRREAEERQRRRYLKMWREADGMLRGTFRLPEAEGKAFETAILRGADAQPTDPNGGVLFHERQADALSELAAVKIADADPDLATVVVHVDAHALAGDNDAMDLASIELGPIISMATAHRLACDGRCQVVVDDLLGRTVEVAKVVHAVPRWLRRRVLHRDGGCRWPGCDRTAFLHAHHIRWWTRDGGPTEEGNLCALCKFHHGLVHEGGWEVAGDPIGRLTFTSPQGRVIQGGPPGLRDDVRDALGLTWSGDPPRTAA